jgi:hypothetical protein
MTLYGIAPPPFALAVAVAEILSDSTPKTLAKNVGTEAFSTTWMTLHPVEALQVAAVLPE